MSLSVSELVWPYLPSLSVGAILGFCAGFAVKRIGRMTVLLVGLLFLALQILAWQGLLTVNWGRVQALAEPWVQRGGREFGAWVLGIVQTNLPFGGGFVAAFLVGLRAR
ncbi:hypothetical protein GCM10008939_18950 [Deinococcus aquiradiocola]|uniref:FUN14 family protein n=1 Tax=Deinococcus aquiradiocola TaxID=393059 RepID=A0A917UQ86_9DEIO|nr:hypothetical protein GCM10008939_18950 [Deinococcus aquiradiocola]